MAGTTVQTSFSTPEAGVAALVEAVKADDTKRMRSILGPGSSKLISSGDKVTDARNRERFVEAYTAANKIVFESDARAVLMIGTDEWPLPIPLVKSGNQWHFDAVQGKKEILARRIGANELAAIQVCLAIVDAEHEYATLLKTEDDMPQYAARFVSTPGIRDGLYWETQGDEPSSPIGPLLAVAANEGYSKSESMVLAPYHGYHYKILTRQGEAALGGAYDYIVNGKMIGGFAVLAYPARYDASGIMSFMVSHDGAVYQKNLGRKTTETAAKIDSFNPDASWKRQ
jgi:hypothetical protein